MSRKVFFMAISILVASCDKYVEISVPELEPRLVLHGYVATGNRFEVAIGKSARPNTYLDEVETRVENAWALVYENDIFRDSLRYDAQLRRYISNTVIAEAGKSYKVIAGASGFVNVEAQTKATLPVNTLSLVHNKNVRTTSYGAGLDDLQFSFQDRGNEKNFYLSTLHPATWSHAGLTCVTSSDPVIELVRGELVPFDGADCIPNDEILFTDKSFNGTIKQLTITAQSESLKPATDQQGGLHHAYLKRYSISEEHYRYLKATVSLAGGINFPRLIEPVSVKGNVKNGFGLLSVYSVVTDSLQ